MAAGRNGRGCVGDDRWDVTGGEVRPTVSGCDGGRAILRGFQVGDDADKIVSHGP
jgi:hypothetical protein